jgi:Mor family transcriptional regulator
LEYNVDLLGDIECGMIDLEGLNGIYKELCEYVGVENMIKIYAQYRGQQITFPVRMFSSKYVKEQVCKRFDGTNLKQLAHDYGYSEKRIRQMLKQSKE